MGGAGPYNVGRDMMLTYNIVTGKDMVNSETWFTSETESVQQIPST
jgi:hypothetical protein